MLLYQTPGRRPLHITSRRANTVTRGWVGAPNERAPFRFHDAVVGFVDRCLSRSRDLAASIIFFAECFSGRSCPNIRPGFVFSFCFISIFVGEIRAHSDECRNISAGIFEIQTFFATALRFRYRKGLNERRFFFFRQRVGRFLGRGICPLRNPKFQVRKRTKTKHPS